MCMCLISKPIIICIIFESFQTARPALDEGTSGAVPSSSAFLAGTRTVASAPPIAVEHVAAARPLSDRLPSPNTDRNWKDLEVAWISGSSMDVEGSEMSELPPSTGCSLSQLVKTFRKRSPSGMNCSLACLFKGLPKT